MRRPVLILALVLGVTVALWRLTSLLAPESPEAESVSVAAALGGEDRTGYARADAPRAFRFPDDHGPHPDYRNEWWYVTGNLTSSTGRRLGYQITFFRIALSPEPAFSDSPWRTNQLYMAHVAVTDAASARHSAHERFSRAALGLAGATARPFRVWLEGWEIESTGADFFPLHITVGTDDFAIDLDLVTVKPLVLQGEDGLSRKSAEPGNASYYYSFTRLRTAGVVRIGHERLDVTGTSWLDREWSTSALGDDQAGWDWFALQLDDGREVMYYQLRTTAGTTHPYSSGVIVALDGEVRRLAASEVLLRPLRHWRSPETQIHYPVAWELILPSERLRLRVEPLIPDQEMQTSARYWEGAVTVDGDLTGVGYLEMVGYGDQD